MRRDDRKEVKSLKRENQRLQKELNKLLDQTWQSEENAKDEEAQERVKTAAKPEKAPLPKCPKCKKGLEPVEIGAFTYRFCEDRTRCRYRVKLK